MLVQSHDSGDFVARQGLSLVEDSWALEVVPRLPANLAEQALALKAFQRVRSLATPRPFARCIGLCLGAPLDAPAGCLGGTGGGSPIFPKLHGVSASVRVARGCSGS